MTAPDAPGFDALPWPLQVAISISVGAAVLIAAGRAYLGKHAAPPVAAKGQDLVLQAAAIADMTPVRELTRQMSDLTNETRGVRHACEAVLAHLLEVEREREEDRRVERRVKEELVARARELNGRRDQNE